MSAVGELCPSVVIREDNNSMLNHTVELCCFIPRQIILGIVSKLYVKNYLDLSTKNLSFYLEIRLSFLWQQIYLHSSVIYFIKVFFSVD